MKLKEKTKKKGKRFIYNFIHLWILLSADVRARAIKFLLHFRWIRNIHTLRCCVLLLLLSLSLDQHNSKCNLRRSFCILVVVVHSPSISDYVALTYEIYLLRVCVFFFGSHNKVSRAFIVEWKSSNKLLGSQK